MHFDGLSTLAVTLGFFDDIYVPVNLLPSPSYSEPDPSKRYSMAIHFL